MLCEVLSTRSCKSSRGVHKVPLSSVHLITNIISECTKIFNLFCQVWINGPFAKVHVCSTWVLQWTDLPTCTCSSLLLQIWVLCMYLWTYNPTVLVTAYLSRCYQPVYHTCTCMCLIRLTVILTGNLNFTTYWFFVLCPQVFVWSSDKERSS